MKKKQTNIYYIVVKKKDIKLNNNMLPIFCENAKIETKKAYSLLFQMLEYLNLKVTSIYKNEYGKPYFKDLNLFFNYSHSENYIAIVIGPCEFGIDIEENREISDLVSEKYLNGIAENKERLKMWVMKEAYSKMKGLGLKFGLENINIIDINATPHYLVERGNYIMAFFHDGVNYNIVELKL